ncbi:UNVERIFIED_CONTAM: hypothetical protein EX528_22120 [Xanthomonas axonopodis]|nr:hypothetical protein Xcom_18865 [Xanthomonas axonopodis pv. commiphoreae]
MTSASARRSSGPACRVRSALAARRTRRESILGRDGGIHAASSEGVAQNVRRLLTDNGKHKPHGRQGLFKRGISIWHMRHRARAAALVLTQ